MQLPRARLAAPVLGPWGENGLHAFMQIYAPAAVSCALLAGPSLRMAETRAWTGLPTYGPGRDQEKGNFGNQPGKAALSH